MWRLALRKPSCAGSYKTSPLRTTGAPLRRSYHEDVVYGYRVPKKFEYPDYSLEQLQNRQQQAALVCLVGAYRSTGHRATDLDPLGLQKKQTIPELDPARYGITDPDARFNIDGILAVPVRDKSGYSSAAEIHQALNDIYCGHVAFEFEHIPDTAEKRWLADYVESTSKESKPDSSRRRRFFELLVRSEAFDNFMQKKFGQVKRYGLEGAESAIVALDELFSLCNQSGITEAVLGMPHRGRLNILIDLLKYPPRALFHKLQGHAEFPESLPASGDVISHISSSPSLNYGYKENLNITMLHNPSHLEAVNPVVAGYGRAKQMYLFDNNIDPSCALGDRLIGIQIHGDAAFTGQGVIMETLGLSNLPHFSLGGTVHIIINNQIGYTTPATNARSTLYTSDIAKLVNAPIIHVNGDYPEEVARAMRIAFEYRRMFRKDVIVDLITFRRWGHNELDEPSFTQPQMYNIIRSRASVPKLYESSILEDNIITKEDAEQTRQSFTKHLEAELAAVKDYIPQADHLKGKWSGLVMSTEAITQIDTGVARETLQEVGRKSVLVDETIKVHPRLVKHHIQPRLKRLEEGTAVDWATAESLAFGSLLKEGYNIRLCGQDVGRGTFSQRHAMFVCQETENVGVPLNNIDVAQGKLEVANSNLSELAVLGFEYGVSIQSPNILPIWEAQFGDFNNAAQVIIDTYVSSGETKWLRQSGLVMLLPHGYDGAGPEHSSSRFERFLQMCNIPMSMTENDVVQNPNMHVAIPTTPAQIFHLLRRQMKRNYRKPLVVAGPKTLLRLSAATSSLDEMLPGTSFRPVIPDMLAKDPEAVTRVVFVAGKLYYDLAKAHASQNEGLRDKIAIVRLEELCPFPRQELLREIARFANAVEFVWCQEETMNAGAYAFICPRLRSILPKGTPLRYIGRGPLAAPVTGISSVFKTEQSQILHDVFANV
ncbi:dehydrogenase E1 and transketolase domain-containing protein [Coemansia reversa NRRL 1564]|uniref:Dehydrogenase E1 and transketolase domain-containing protein n=1 Tax=Coemansia reversa (strain ATCC 12441 / NRRL 1564) TaxID=763665 RepID=A0A2G5BJC5_COERN|nr:dehydrogenase E1 and transketolase domain-containing protein [Coemansia reversa NRRL 1564]|eukprot:PIA18857.1 dehydrogenase E1 and transketolase domain-containing protein [Coemansia reversa NRRL 1564]